MSSDAEVGIGKIKWLDIASKSGIISQEGDDADAYFEIADVEIGSPREGQTVQFTKEKGRLGVVAKRIVILSDVARGARQRRV